VPEPLLFLGAGASAPFGIPTMKQMVPLFEETLSSEPELDVYFRTKRGLETQFGAERVDLEAIFTVFDSAINAGKLSDLGLLPAFYLSRFSKVEPDALITDILQDKEVLKSLRSKFEQFVQQRCTLLAEHHQKVIPTYDTLFAEISKRFGGNLQTSQQGFQVSNLPIFTTNYDLCLEFYFTASNVEFLDGFQFNPRNSKNELNPQILHDPNHPRPRLFKLHGSISWVWLDNKTVIKSPDPLPQVTWDGRKPSGQLILYPIQNKATYVTPFIDMFYEFAYSLRTNRNWVVIGYSFNDDTIREMFLSNFTSNKKLILVHPEADDLIANRLKAIGSSIIPITSKFGESDTMEKINVALDYVTRSPR
jgi:hypothetical protein